MTSSEWAEIERLYLEASILTPEPSNPPNLIHEAFLKLVGSGEKAFQNRTHFFSVASTAMRQVLVNHAETSLAAKRGGDLCNVPLDESDAALQKEVREVLALNEALDTLQKLDSRKSRVVELRYVGGLSIDETAEALSVSPGTGRPPAPGLLANSAWAPRSSCDAKDAGWRHSAPPRIKPIVSLATDSLTVAARKSRTRFR